MMNEDGLGREAEEGEEAVDEEHEQAQHRDDGEGEERTMRCVHVFDCFSSRSE